MRFFSRSSLVAGLTALLVGSGFWPGVIGQAAAVDNNCLPGGACVMISYIGDSSDIPYSYTNVYTPVDLNWHIMVYGGTLASATLVTHDDPSIHAPDWTVWVDGNILDPAAVTMHGIDLTIDLASVMPVPAGGGIDIRYIGSYSADLWPVTPTLTSTVALTFDDAAHTGPVTVISPPAVRHVELPDLSLSTAASSLSAPHGGNAALGVNVLNRNGKAAPLGASLILDFPPGFDLGPARAGRGYDSPFCNRTGVRQWECNKNHTGGTFTATLQIAAAPGLRIGSTGWLKLQAWSSSPDANRADNTRYVALTAVGNADLRIQIQSPPDGALPSGTPQRVTVRISNAGPDEATGIVATVNVSDHNQPPQLVVLGVGGQRWRADQTSQRLPISRLAAGVADYFTLTLTGSRVGATATVSASAKSDSYDVGGAYGSAGLRLVALSQTAALPPSGSLAATGPAAELPMMLAAAMLALGCLLMVLARSRRTDD